MSTVNKFDNGGKEFKRRTSKLIVESLIKNCGVRLLALDFDRTIVSIHTAGFWQYGPERLAAYVRPCFRKLMSASLKSSMFVCVVTFSMQTDLIRNVLRIALPKSDTDKIIVRGLTSTVIPTGIGKEQHLSAVLKEIYNCHRISISPEQILLIDDDDENIAIAKRNRHRIFQVKGDVNMHDIDAYVQSLEKEIWTQYG